MNILVTGGTGFIGSHTVVKLIEEGHQVTILDNLCNSKVDVLDAIKEITGVKPDFYEADIRNIEALDKIFAENEFEAVIHFAGLKAVGESVAKPLEYYENNISGSLNLYKTMIKYRVFNLVFSSSATVYGDGVSPLKESDGQGICTNPYGETKKMNENILTDLCKANPEMSVVLLRYFNPIGAHKSGLIGEDPNGIPNNLLPYVSKVAVGELEKVNVFGNDYDTVDGTGVRDYIHVLDLARGHVLAIKYAAEHKGADVINLGTGKGYSVLQIINAYSKAAGFDIPYVIAPRRAGDIATCFASTDKAYELLGFKTEYEIEEMCKDSYNFILKRTGRI